MKSVPWKEVFFTIWYYQDAHDGWSVCHREDGPAVEYESGLQYWYLHDKSYPFDEWIKLTPISFEEKILVKLRYC